MGRINLHMHSKYSLDGLLGVNELVSECFNDSIDYLSVTDHDNCDVYFDLDIKQIKGSGTLLYGMEADAIINDVTYDILCYGFQLDNVSEWAKKQYGTISSRQNKIYNELLRICENLNLQLDNSIPYNSNNEFAHMAIFRMLNNNENKKFLEKYDILNGSDLYRLSTMDKSFPLYVDMHIVWPTIEELSEIIHNNGGKIFLAHPYKYAKNLSVDSILEQCSAYVDGIEIYNETNNEEEVKYLYDYAMKNNLLISAGSDFHGSKKHSSLDVNLSLDMEKVILKWINEVEGKIDI